MRNRFDVRGMIVAVSATVVLGAPLPGWAAPDVKWGAVTLHVNGAPAKAFVAAPASGEVRQIALVAHGYAHTALEWRERLEQLASHGALAVGVDYPVTFHGIARGGAEVLAFGRYYRARYPAATIYLVAVSMGSAVAGVAIGDAVGSPALASLTDPIPFDYWVNVEPLSNLAETYAEAALVTQTCAAPEDRECFGRVITADIERETGGTPAEVPLEYRRRSSAALAPEIARAHLRGLRAGIVVHALNDGLVPYNQGRELAGALAAAGVPLDMYTVLRGECPPPPDAETTMTGHATGEAGENPTVRLPDCLAGHASEGHLAHIVIETGIQALLRLMRDEVPPAYREFAVDRDVCPPSAPCLKP